MQGDDETFRVLLMVGMALVALLWGFGAWLRPVAGWWRDGGRLIELTQVGPFVRGRSTWPGGAHAYRGRVFWGRLHLTRYDFGAQHLHSLGFSPEQIPLMEGRATAYLILHLEGETRLSGKFYGRKFSFDKNRLVGATPVAPAERTWERTSRDEAQAQP
ncbi:MAG TPA: hypothetical protein VFH51_00205 [Myxococcota bacterium]|nr:hypothetical protein [Myxococcota bacterium]